MSIYDSGDSIRLSAIFTDTAFVTGDPTTVLFAWRTPAGTTGTAQYGVGTAIVRQATGVYTFDTAVGQAGSFWYRWQATGTLVAAEEKSFTIRQPRV